MYRGANNGTRAKRIAAKNQAPYAIIINRRLSLYRTYCFNTVRLGL